MIRLRISEDALEDLNEGDEFYETQERGLGNYFIGCIRADIEGLKVTGGVHRIVFEDYHRLLSKVFPFGIFYTFEADIAIVWAVIDLRTDPDWVIKKLED